MLRALDSVPPDEAVGGDRLAAALARVTDPGQLRPRLRPDIEIARFTTSWGNGYAIAHSPASGAYLRFGRDEADIVACCDGTRSVAELVVERLHVGAPLGADTVVELVLLLRSRGFLDQAPLDVYAAVADRLATRRHKLGARVWRFVKHQTIPIPGADAFTGWLYAAGGRLAFTPPAVLGFTTVIALGVAAFIALGRRGSYSIAGHVSTATALSLFGLGLVALFIHEMSHALAVRHGGRRVVSAGFQLYLAHPAFFIDSTDLTLASPRARAVNAAAGPYAEAAAAGVAAIAAFVAPSGTAASVLFRFAGITYLNVLLNLVPFLELDGYWLVSDLLDVPRLRPRAFAVLRFELPDRLRRRRGPLTPAERGLVLFGVASVIFTVAALATAWTFWGPIARRLTTALWDGGIGGRVVLGLLAALVIGPALSALGRSIGALGRHIAASADGLRFRLQSGWRVEAAEAIAGLPLLGAAELDPADMAELAGRVRRVRVEAGAVIVRQGSAASAFYLVRSGLVSVLIDGAGGSELIRHLGPGESFGEVALVEGTPRTATVRADHRCELFEIDAGTFGRLLAPAAVGPESLGYRRSLLEVWSLPPFRHLSQTEAVAVAGRGDWHTYAPGQTVIRQGERGDRFYVLAAGQAEVLVDAERIRILHAGERFGELALVHAVPRTATVRALTRARLFSLDAHGFGEFLSGTFDRAGLPALVAEHIASGRH